MSRLSTVKEACEPPTLAVSVFGLVSLFLPYIDLVPWDRWVFGLFILWVVDYIIAVRWFGTDLHRSCEP